MKVANEFGANDNNRDDIITELANVLNDPSEYKVFWKLFLPSMSQIELLELWQPETDEAHPSQGQVTNLTDGMVRTATDQRHPPNRKPTDCDNSLSHIPAAPEIRTTEPVARDASFDNKRSSLESNTSRAWGGSGSGSQTLIFDMSPEEPASKDGGSKSCVTRPRVCAESRLDCSNSRTPVI